ncbi:MAG TPA: undecaprenyl-diphosphate phosphatase [Acidimicrobiales bacterium]|nr:undecaprenyl-diphosphate phosphatase [Acidimicrobiales bacterium]
MLSYLQAIVIGFLQGFTELFPVSSLGHSVLVPAWLGWHNLVNSQSAGSGQSEFFLAFIVGLHVATALALLWFFRAEWVRIIGGFFSSIRTRSIEGPSQRLAWLLVVATIPAGIMGIALEHKFRTIFAKPAAAAVFLMVNGLILIAGERLRRRDEVRALAARMPQSDTSSEPGRRLDTLNFKEAGVVGVAQVFALLAGISRSGITMVAGLVRGLDHEDAARFSFLLATPIILAAGLYKIPDLISLGHGIYGQILVGSICAGVGAYVSVRFLVRWFKTRTLWPFAVYCLVVGAISVIHFA